MNAKEREKWISKFHEPVQTSGRVIVLPHAGGSANFYWGLSAEVSACGMECVAIQYPGRQERLLEEPVESIEEYADRIAEVLAGLDDIPTILFGHSMGALIGYNLLARYESKLPFVDAFVASAHLPPTSRSMNGDVDLASDEAVLAHLKKLGGFDEQLLLDSSIIELILPAVKNDLQAVANFSMPHPVKLQVPILSIIGRDDLKTDLESASEWATYTSGHFQLVQRSGGHFYFADEPKELATIILQAGRIGGRSFTT